MPPKEEKKEKRPKVNVALEMHADVDLKRLYDGGAKQTADMEPVQPFLRRARAEQQQIKDGDRLDPPNIPLFLAAPMTFPTVRALFTILEPYPWLRVVQLFHCNIGDDGAMVLADFLRVYRPTKDKNPFGVETLELPRNRIGPKGAAVLGRALTQNESVKILCLDFNPIGDDGAAALGDGLKWNATVERLSLEYCDVGPLGGESIGRLILGSSSVRDLSVKGNPLGPHGVTHMSHALVRNAYVTTMCLADTAFGMDMGAIEALRDGVAANESLEAIDLRLNSLIPAGMTLLLELLRQKPKLQRFDVHERISDDVYRDMLDAVADNVKRMKKKKKKKG